MESFGPVINHILFTMSVCFLQIIVLYGLLFTHSFKVGMVVLRRTQKSKKKNIKY